MKFISTKPIVLASSSPRRKELLKLAGLDFTVKPSYADEDLPYTPKEPHLYAVRLSEKKADAVFADAPGSIVIAADTIVVRNGSLYPKPVNDAQAVEFLMELSGQIHEVITGVTVLTKGKKIQLSSLSQVKFRTLDLELVEEYVRSGDAADKAGAYGIQTEGMLFVESIVGEYQNIVGLPIAQLIERLRQEELVVLEAGAAKHAT
ncbi:MULTISPECIES: Maf family protein [Sporosarcina]|uniref:Maf family protein n=1 Tax=Sporosarcina TaxID=1569 RepID=UPI00129A867C|nr:MULTISPECIES: Maf family protein [Sporosarcina]GKV65713.1 septum formation protein Maf [Sporosarcina sp. NCCP-2331]GLB55837.1 septum formation protein Maf [Sporosarcina sp. NCCP-2378]